MTTSPAPDDASANSLLRSEERLQVCSQWIAAQRVVARRRIVSETVQLNVTVRREELIFDETPLPGAPAEVPIPYAPPVVVVLREEVPVVTLITKPYEQATISVVQVAGEQQIVASLGSERLALDTDDQTNAAKATASNT